MSTISSTQACPRRPRRSARRIISVFLASCAAGVALALWPGSAHAHAALAASNPGAGSTVRALPDEVWLELNEEVKEPAFVAVLNGNDERVNSETVSVEGRRVVSKIPNDTEPGDYTMSYRIVSADAHAVTGTINFTVSGKPASASPTPPQPSATQTPDEASIRPNSQPTSIQSMPDDSTNYGAYIVMAFFAIAMLGLVGIIRAGMKSGSAIDED